MSEQPHERSGKGSINPITILKDAVRAVPAMKYALAVLGLVAVVAIVSLWRVKYEVAIFGAVIILGLMVPVLVFAKLTKVAPRYFLGPARAFMWAFVALTIVAGTCLFTAAAFRQPRPLYELIFDKAQASGDRQSAKSDRTQKAITMTASIWKVDLDTKGELVGTKELSERGNGVSSNSLEKLAEWVSDRLGVGSGTNAAKVRLKVQIPADLDRQRPTIERIPGGAMDVLLWDLRGSVKGRMPLTWESLQGMKAPFHLEIRVPGSETTVIEATPGTALSKDVELERAVVRIGVEKFLGFDEGISQRVCNQLSANPLIKISSPEMLETIRKQVEAHNENIRRNPMVQKALRSLGIDFIISGSVAVNTP